MLSRRLICPFYAALQQLITCKTLRVDEGVSALLNLAKGLAPASFEPDHLHIFQRRKVVLAALVQHLTMLGIELKKMFRDLHP